LSYGVKANYLLDRFNKEDNAKARALLEAVTALDPHYVLAYVWLGVTHALAANYGWSVSPFDSFQHAHELARKALALDDQSASVRIMLATIYLFKRQHDAAIVEGELAISLDPNFSIGHALLAQIMFFAGRFAEAIALTEKAMRLSPCKLNPNWAGPFLKILIASHRTENQLNSDAQVLEGAAP
jgi:tetratricopeptide (TPR) repeat protein